MIERRKTKRGELRYEVRLRRPDGREYSRTFRTKKEAERYQATERADRSRGTWIDPTAGQMSFADCRRRVQHTATSRAPENARGRPPLVTDSSDQALVEVTTLIVPSGGLVTEWLNRANTPGVSHGAAAFWAQFPSTRKSCSRGRRWWGGRCVAIAGSRLRGAMPGARWLRVDGRRRRRRRSRDLGSRRRLRCRWVGRRVAVGAFRWGSSGHRLCGLPHIPGLVGRRRRSGRRRRVDEPTRRG